MVQHAWSIPVHQVDMAKRIGAKLKKLRRVLRAWQHSLSNLKTVILDTKLIILLFDTFEEARDLSLEEWNFRKILQCHLATLLQKQKIYWKQRGTIKWVKFGDEGMNFLHANATVKYRKKLITSLTIHSSHEEKASILWEAYKQRLGTSHYQAMHFNLSSLLEPVTNLDWLEADFTKEEIDTVVTSSPSYKSLGPDGFNSDFLKQC